MDILRENIIHRLGFNSEVDVLNRDVLSVCYPYDLVEPRVDIDRRIDKRKFFYILHLAVHPVKGIVVNQFWVKRKLVVPDWIAKKEPAVIVLPKLIRIDRHRGERFSCILEFAVPEADYLPS